MQRFEQYTIDTTTECTLFTHLYYEDWFLVRTIPNDQRLVIWDCPIPITTYYKFLGNWLDTWPQPGDILFACIAGDDDFWEFGFRLRIFRDIAFALNRLRQNHEIQVPA